MDWHKKCRLCLTDNPMRPVHVLQSLELRKLLKDLCKIEIQDYDNMDLVCTNCVQVVTTLKFFISNQRVIGECRGFQQIMLNIKEENESSDCAIIDNKRGLDSNKNDRLKENIAIDAHEAPVVSTINNSKLSNTKRKASRDDANSFDSSILLATDEDTSFNDTSPKLKKCKVILTRTNPFETKEKNSIASISSAATITKNNTNTNSQTTQSVNTITTTKDCTGTRNNQVNQRKSITTTTIVSEAEVCSTYNIHSSKVPASTTRIPTPTIITQKALNNSKSSGSGNNNEKPQANVTLPNPTLMIRKALDNSKTSESSRIFLLAHNKVNNNEKPKAGVTIPNSSLMIRKALDNSETSECTVNLLLPPNKVKSNEIPKANIKKQFTSTSKGFNQFNKDIQCNNCPNMKVLTTDELNNKSQSNEAQSKQAVGVVNPYNPNTASEILVRIVRNGLNFGVRLQKCGCAVTVSHLSSSQLNHIRTFIKEALNGNKNIQFLFSMGVPDEETKSLFRVLQMDYAK